MNNIEIEIKFPILNFHEIIRWLDKNSEFQYEAKQLDIYFNPPHKDFIKDIESINEWLRLRISDKKIELNYKDWQPHEEKIKTHCIEFETQIKSYDSFREIFNALDFKEIIRVNKLRKVYNHKDVEISIDVVENLGEYIELEFKGDNGNINEVRNKLLDLLKKMGAITGEIDLKGYPYRLIEIGKQKE